MSECRSPISGFDLEYGEPIKKMTVLVFLIFCKISVLFLIELFLILKKPCDGQF